MKATPVKIGLVDSGLPGASTGQKDMAFRFALDQDGLVRRLSVQPDTLGHGSAVGAILLHHVPTAEIYNAQVFDQRGVTTAITVAAAIDWLVSQKVDVVNLSLGLREDRAVLAEACARAVAAGVLLVASAPAQGAPVYPSHYPGVIRATGDARCAENEISWLDSAQADFGGCVRAIGSPPTEPPRIGGASLGTAHVSGQLAALLQKGVDRKLVREMLVSRATYVHSERRTE